MKKNKKLVLLSILAALAAVLKMMSIVILNNKLVFHNIPIMLASLTFGPLYGVLCAIIADVASIPTTPNWNIFFMFPQIFWGLIPGLLKKSNLWLIEIITYLLVSTGNTIVLWLLYGQNVAFGTVHVRQFIAINFLNRTYTLYDGEVIYLRIILVIVIMIIKVPIDVLIIRKIFTIEDFRHTLS